jgi:hypothetical protein
MGLWSNAKDLAVVDDDSTVEQLAFQAQGRATIKMGHKSRLASMTLAMPFRDASSNAS